MTEIAEPFKQFIRETVAELLQDSGQIPVVIDLIDPEEAAEICGCDKSVILSLVKDDSTGFPAATLGPRTIRIDRVRLASWLANGGLNGLNK